MITNPKLDLLIRIDQQIRFEKTGCQEVFADMLGISRKTLNNYLDYMRDRCGLIIKYNWQNYTYYYEEGSKYEIKLGKY